MKLRMGVLAAVAALVGTTSTMAAQIRAGSSIGRQQVNNAPMMLVGNPIPASAQDSSLAVELGSSLRERMARMVGRDYQIVTRERMNEALDTYGYHADALLPPFEVRRLILAANGTLYVHGSLSRNAQGGIMLSQRFASTRSSDGAGYIANTVQQSGESLDRFAQRAVDALKDPVKAYADARQCVDNAATDRAKARSAAEKALKAVPNYGLAEFCLGALAVADDSVSAAGETHFRNALRTDSMAIPAYSALALINFYRSDTTGTVGVWQQVLRVEPRNQQLRDQAFELFRQFGRQDAAEEVADEGIRLDPNNFDWYDLKSNTCLAQEKFTCALEVLEQGFSMDSTRADTAFFRNISAAAQFAGDNDKFVHWATIGAERYPDDRGMLSSAARANGIAGNVEKAKEYAAKLLVIDPEDTEPVQFVVAAISQMTDGPEKIEATRELWSFNAQVRDSYDDMAKTYMAQAYVNASSNLYNAADYAGSRAFADSALAMGIEDTELLSYAGFFSAFSQISSGAFNEEATAIRGQGTSCAALDAYAAKVDGEIASLKLATQSSNAQVASIGSDTLAKMEEERAQIPVLRQRCR